MPTDPRTRFTATVSDYVRHRPSYPEALLDWVAQTTGVVPPARVVDLGAGTGIATRQLAARGYRVTGVEPNAAMLDAARAAGGGPAWVRGEAEDTGLPAGSADLVVAAQAFHWFRVPETMKEIRRLTGPQGRAAAWWNIRATTPFLLEYAALLHHYRTGAGPEPTGAARRTLEAIRACAEVRDVTEEEFPNRQLFDLAGLIGRARSTSYVQEEMPDRPAFERELATLFGRFAHDGRVEFVYQCTGICWRMRPA